MAYYENAGMLREHYATLRKLPRELRDRIQVIIVDDGSPLAPAWGEDCGVSLSVYRIGVDVRWNQDAARNIAARHASHAWLLLTDIDHLVPELTWKSAIEARLTKGTIYRFSRVSMPKLDEYKPHPNSWLMTRGTFERIGGYDERFAGFYGTDADFRDRARMVAPVDMTNFVLIRYPRDVIPDASTTSYERKTPEDGAAIKRIKEERAQLADQTPLRYRCAYAKIY